MSNAPAPTWLEQVDRLRAHLNALRHHHAEMMQQAAAGNAKVARFLPDVEADIEAVVVRLSDLAAF